DTAKAGTVRGGLQTESSARRARVQALTAIQRRQIPLPAPSCPPLQKGRRPAEGSTGRLGNARAEASGRLLGREQTAPDGPAPELRHELVEALQHEEDGLEVPHLVVLADDGVDRERALLGAVEGVAHLLLRREHAGAEDADLPGVADEPELDGEPVE